MTVLAVPSSYTIPPLPYPPPLHPSQSVKESKYFSCDHMIPSSIICIWDIAVYSATRILSILGLLIPSSSSSSSSYFVYADDDAAVVSFGLLAATAIPLDDSGAGVERKRRLEAYCREYIVRLLPIWA